MRRLTRVQLIVASTSVAVVSLGALALGHASAPDAPPRLPEVRAQPLSVKKVGDGLLVPPKAQVPE